LAEDRELEKTIDSSRKRSGSRSDRDPLPFAEAEKDCQFTVSEKVAECDSVPEVPFTVIVAGPAGVPVLPRFGGPLQPASTSIVMTANPQPQASFFAVRRAMMKTAERARARLRRDHSHSGEYG